MKDEGGGEDEGGEEEGSPSSSESAEGIESSSSDSSSSSESDGSKSEDPRRAALPASSSSGAPKAKAAARPKRIRVRPHDHHWGLNFMTPRRSNEETLGWQMTCTNPRHDKCSKEVSNRVSGSSEEGQRMLMLWVLLRSPDQSFRCY